MEDIKTMRTLNSTHKYMIREAVQMEGSFDPDKIMFIFEEMLTMQEAISIRRFLNWVVQNNKPFGSGNIGERWKHFLQSEK